MKTITHIARGLFWLCLMAFAIPSLAQKKLSPKELLGLADRFVQTPITQQKKASGEVFLQRNMDSYLKQNFFDKNNLPKNVAPDHGHDHKDEQLLEFLNRPHPSVSTMRNYFLAAAREFHVPVELLMAIGQVQSNWAQVSESMYGSWGVTGLIENKSVQQITQAANLLQVSPQQIKEDAQTNIRAAAALLATYQKVKQPKKLEDWFDAAKELTGLPDPYYREQLAARYFKVIKEGVTTVTLWREIITLNPVATDISGLMKETVPGNTIIKKPFPVGGVQSVKGKAAAIKTPNPLPADYSGAVLNLTSCNYSSRGGEPIQYYFVHYVATGTYEGAISWFKDCSSQVSAHYVIRNSDGQITQVVMEANRAWSQGVDLYNDRGVGTEHEVLTTNLAMWYSDPMLTAAGQLANDVCTRRGIPKIRAVAQPGINGHNDVKSTSCPNMTQAVWDLFMSKVALAAGGGAPARPTLYTVSNPGTGTGVTATWKANTETNLAGYRLYYATNDVQSAWALAADETTLTAATTQVTLNSAANFVTVPSGNVYHFKLVAVGTDPQGQKLESPASDIYSRSSNAGGQSVLIVDGFDRNSGSYTGANHSFATNYLIALRDSRNLQVSTAANERVADGSVNLSNYQLVVWFVGDESTTNETFDATEQTKVSNYLTAGGKLIVSGSEIAWDLDNNGSTADKAFINNYLKAKYVGDGASNYTPATGIAATAFSGLTIPFGISYPEDFPDNITTNGGSSFLFSYAVASTNGGVGYKGTFGTGTVPGGVVYVSFPLETASQANHTSFTDKALTYLNIATSPTAVNDAVLTNKGQAITINVLANDLANGSTLNPATVTVVTNPANGTTTVNTTDGKITYTPNSSFTGTETFTYKVANSNGDYSATATVQVTVTIPTACGTSGPEYTLSYPKRDLRGAWISTVSNIDWPSSNTATPAQQMAELKTMLDTLQSAGINAVFFQVRPESDALYASTIEPWSYYLTGQQGLAPTGGFDPLAFIITEAHARGMELHAWLNPYRAKQSTPTLAANHVASLHPDWTFVSGTVTFLNPGLPAVRQHVVNVVADIANRYNVDGIHFDDYFYPYSGMGTQDATTYTNNNPNGLSLANWRRDNVNQLVAQVYDRIQLINTQLNKNIRFGISPFGIWKSGVPAGVTGLSSYDDIYCDPIAWLQAGKVDYLAPQLYWGFSGGQDYTALSAWWDDQVATYGRHLYPGLALYRLNESGWPASTIQLQIDENRKGSNEAALGQLFFTTNDITGNDKSIKTLLQQNQYKYKAVPPAMSWKDGVCPATPTNLAYQSNKLKWNKPSVASDGDTAQKYIVYRFGSTSEITANAQDGTKIIGVTADTSFSITTAMLSGLNNYFVVSALDKNNNESVFSTELNITTTGSDSCTSTLTNLVVDDGSAGFSKSANWVATTATAGYQGTGYYQDNNANKGSVWMSYSPSVAGVYDVYTWHTAGTNRATNALFRIKHNGGTTDVLVNQQINNATWVYLGRFTFTASTTDKVQLRNDNTNGVVIGDAVKFTFVGCPGDCIPPVTTEKIVDDPAAVLTGSWTTGTSAGYYGTAYKHDSGTGQGTKTATYTPNLSVAGSYELFTWYVAGTNRATNVPIVVQYKNGSTTVTLNQQTNGGVWKSLGTFDFDTTAANKVIVKNDAANGVVIADAFRWVYKGCATGIVTLARTVHNEQPVEVTVPETNAIMVYPNPFQHQLKVHIQSTQAGAVRIKVFDVTGKLVTESIQTIGTGETQTTINSGMWQKGVYLLKAELPNGTIQTVKLLKQ